MTARPDFTAADAAAAARTLQRCPAASGYGDVLREKRSGIDPIAREAERVRAMMAAVGAVVVTPADEVVDGEREVRRAIMQRFRS